MRRLRYLIDGRLDKHMERGFHLFSSSEPDDSGGGGDDDSYRPPSTQVERGRGRTTSAPPPPPPPPPRDDGPDPAQRLASVVGIPPTLVEIAQSASPEVRAANTAANDAAFERFFAEQPTVTNLGNVVATPIVDVAASDIVNMPGSFERTDTTGSEASVLPPAPSYAKLSGEALNINQGPPSADYDPRSPITQQMMADLEAAKMRRAQQDQTIPPAPVTVMDMGLDVGPGFEEPSVLPANMVDRYTGMDSDPVGQTFSNIQGEVNALTSRGPLGREMMRQLSTGAGARPNFDMTRDEGQRLRGVYQTNDVFGFPVTTYTGLDNPTGMMNDATADEAVPPVTNPLTGGSQCPDGYVFDEDLQACRRKTKRELQADNGTGGGSSTPPGDMFYRRTSLDDAPANLPSGFNFADANRAFTQSFAYRPSFYRNPMDTTGFTKLL